MSSPTKVSAGLTSGVIKIADKASATGTSASSQVGAVVQLNSSEKIPSQYLSTGVHLGGIAANNLLDDYEEGTWTPTQSVGGNSSISASDAQYVKVGRMVHFDCVISFSGNDVDRVSISGLPFTATNTSAVAISYSGGPFDHLKMLVSGTTIVGSNTTGDASYTEVNGMTARFSGTYMATT